jgi:hypothetical protein
MRGDNLNENRIIRRIDYKLRLNSLTNDTTYDVEQFFLQFSGETVFFSDIEYTTSNETDFLVFENTDGCFAFSLFNYDNYMTFNSNERIAHYRVTAYIPRDNEFTVVQYIDIPLMLIASDSLRLVQEDYIIKTQVSNSRNLSVYVFNSESISFELMENEIPHNPIDYDMPGLLLGLSDSRGNMRTLFIRKEDGEIRVDEYSNQIIFSRNDMLFTLKHYTLEKDFYSDGSGNETDYRTGALSIKKLMYAPIGVDLTDIYDNIFDFYTWGYYDNLDIPLYVGEDYICYVQNSFHTGGGSWRVSPSRIRFDRIDDLSDFVYDDERWGFGGIVPNFDENLLCDLIFNDRADYFYQSNIHSYGDRMNPYVDFTQLSLKRNHGRWSLMLPVMEEYHHPGNGSYGNWINIFAVFSNDVPDFLNTNEEIIELGGWSNWFAKDFFKFPDSDAVLFQYDYFIGIYSQYSQYFNNWGESEDYDAFIPVNIDEFIVSISFSNAENHEIWINQLNELNEITISTE